MLDDLNNPRQETTFMAKNNTPTAALTTQQGQLYSLTDKKLEQWFASLEKSNTNPTLNNELPEDDEGLATQFLSRFGMKNSLDVIAFLNSAEGTDLTAMVHDELAEIAAMEDYEEFLAAEETKREHRMLGFLLLALMYEQGAEGHSFNEIIAAQNAQALKRAHASVTSRPTDETSLAHDILTKQYDAFDSAVTAVDEKLKVKNTELEAVDKTLADLDQQSKELNAEHELFDDHLSQFNEFADKTAQHPHQPETIEQQITLLHKKMDTQLEEIQSLIEAGKNDDVRQQLKERQGLHLQMAGLNDLHDVSKGQKYFCDREGKQVTSPKDAHLVLNTGKKIVKDPADDRYHVLAAHEDLQSIKSSANAQERLNTSHKHYQQALTNNASVHTQVAHNKKLKEEHHLQRHSAALAQKATLQGDISLLSTQKTKLKTAQAEVERKLTRSRPTSLSAPNETIAPNSSAPTLKPTLEPQAQPTRKSPQKSHKELINALNNLKKDRTPEAIIRFRDLIKPYANHPQFKSVSDKIEEIKNMPRWAPIPQITMQSLLQNMERFGVNAEKPEIMPLDSATLAKTADETPEEYTPSATPLSTKPSPFH